MRSKLKLILIVSVLFLSACSSGTSEQHNPSASAQAVGPTIVRLVSAESVLGIVIDAERKVIAIEPDSAAEAAGLQLGDTIEQINGFALADQSNRASIKQSLQNTPNSRIALLRAGGLIELEAAPKPLQPPSSEGLLLTPTPVQPSEDYL